MGYRAEARPSSPDTRGWPLFFDRLTRTGRAQTLDLNGTPCWIATERLPHIAASTPLPTTKLCHPERRGPRFCGPRSRRTCGLPVLHLSKALRKPIKKPI